MIPSSYSKQNLIKQNFFFQNYPIHGRVSDHIQNVNIGNSLKQRIHDLEQKNQKLKQVYIKYTYVTYNVQA